MSEGLASGGPQRIPFRGLKNSRIVSEGPSTLVAHLPSDEPGGGALRPALFALLSLSFLLAEPAFGAIKFERFPHRPDGTVSVKAANVMQARQAAIIFVMPETHATPIRATR